MRFACVVTLAPILAPILALSLGGARTLLASYTDPTAPAALAWTADREPLVAARPLTLLERFASGLGGPLFRFTVGEDQPGDQLMIRGEDRAALHRSLDRIGPWEPAPSVVPTSLGFGTGTAPLTTPPTGPEEEARGPSHATPHRAFEPEPRTVGFRLVDGRADGQLVGTLTQGLSRD